MLKLLVVGVGVHVTFFGVAVASAIGLGRNGLWASGVLVDWVR